MKEAENLLHPTQKIHAVNSHLHAVYSHNKELSVSQINATRARVRTIIGQLERSQHLLEIGVSLKNRDKKKPGAFEGLEIELDRRWKIHPRRPQGEGICEGSPTYFLSTFECTK